MTKFLIIVTALYFLYFIGNIVYDLFLKKEATISTQETDVFSLVEFEEQNRGEVTTVGIDDVENLNTPNSFSKKEFPIIRELSEERQDLEMWRQRFASEQNMDSFDFGSVKAEVQNKIADELMYTKSKEPVLLQNENTEDEANQIRRKIYEKKWEQLWNNAETTVQMISNNNGHKVYQAVM